MPLKRCGENNSGWKWGDSGKCYSSKQDAIKQMQAILISQKKHAKGEELSKISEELEELERELIQADFEVSFTESQEN